MSQKGWDRAAAAHTHTGTSAQVQGGTLVDALIQENHSVTISPAPGSLLLRELSCLDA